MRSGDWTRARAVRFAHALAAIDVLWLEAPLAPEDVRGHARLARRSSGADRPRRVLPHALRDPAVFRARRRWRAAARSRTIGDHGSAKAGRPRRHASRAGRSARQHRPRTADRRRRSTWPRRFRTCCCSSAIRASSNSRHGWRTARWTGAWPACAVPQRARPGRPDRRGGRSARSAIGTASGGCRAVDAPLSSRISRHDEFRGHLPDCQHDLPRGRQPRSGQPDATGPLSAGLRRAWPRSVRHGERRLHALDATNGCN